MGQHPEWCHLDPTATARQQVNPGDVCKDVTLQYASIYVQALRAAWGCGKNSLSSASGSTSTELPTSSVGAALLLGRDVVAGAEGDVVGALTDVSGQEALAEEGTIYVDSGGGRKFLYLAIAVMSVLLLVGAVGGWAGPGGLCVGERACCRGAMGRAAQFTNPTCSVALSHFVQPVVLPYHRL